MHQKSKTNSKYKDSVFTALFSNEVRILELYNALEGTHYKDPSIIKINTLPDVFFMNRQNDIFFTVGDKVVVLVEHQSTINENMPLRFLIYISRLYEKIIDGKAIYKSKLLKIPKPEFIVLYNGRDNYPKEKILKLSDSFESRQEQSIKIPENALELTVRVININKGKNDILIKKSPNLNGYSQFVAKVREFENSGFILSEAIIKAIKFCLNKKILFEFLTENSSEVINMLLVGEWDMETALKVREEEAWETGLQKGLQKGLKALMKMGLSMKDAKKELGLA
ncbi:hypothetical protein AGMMS49938_05210 [Fibrobacterales bacterium]|nr:hypothetical protein AGMMS49938_05210 [Fibrobacterales bacterium]